MRIWRPTLSRFICGSRVAATLCLVASISALAVQAAGSTIVRTCDESHLRAAIAAAGAGGSVTFACSGSITLEQAISFDSSTSGLSIDGNDQQVTITLTKPIGAPSLFAVGAGVAVSLANMTISNPIGAGISNDGTLSLNRTTFTGNSPTTVRECCLGGAIFNTGTLVVRDSTFSGNVSLGGGAIFSSGALDIAATTFSGNVSFGLSGQSGSGGAIESTGPLHVTNSTFSNNVAEGSGPHVGIAVGGAIDGGAGTVTNSTFSGNSSEGGSAISSPKLRFINTIVANSSGGNCATAVLDGGGNVDSGSSCGFNAPASRSDVDPQLQPLASNGGPTQTLAIPSSSPAVGLGIASVCLDTPVGNTDQRGLSRHADTRGACDSGAYDTGGTGTTVTTPRVVTLLPESSGRALQVQSKISCSPPSADLTGPIGGDAQTTTTVTQDHGAIVGQTSTALPCGRSGFTLEANADSPAFHLGDGQISVTWSVQWLRSGCTGGDCVVREEGSAAGVTEVVPSGTQPPGVPPPF